MNSDADLVSPELINGFKRILDLIQDASVIAIAGHTSPDGDALGSVLGLGCALRAHFPLKRIGGDAGRSCGGPRSVSVPLTL